MTIRNVPEIIHLEGIAWLVGMEGCVLGSGFVLFSNDGELM